MNDEVYILGAGMIRFGKYAEKSVKQMTCEAMESLFDDIDVDSKDIEAAWYSNSGWGMTHGQHCIRGQVALAPVGLQGIPIINVENACAGASTAVHQAQMSLKAGEYDLVLAVGCEKVWLPEDKKKMFEGFMAGTDVEFSKAVIESMRLDAARKQEEKRDSTGSEGSGSGDHSGFMDIYSMGARQHMEKHGTTQRQLAIISSKNHNHGSLNPLAQYQVSMTVDEVLADKMVSFPLTRPMCAPVGDGAAAALLGTRRALKRYPGAKPVRILASTLASGALPGSDFEYIGKRLSSRAYEMAGVGPEDIDIAEIHDATAFGELMQCEELGLCPTGEGGPFAESGATSLGGRLPVNTSGGLECRGHPVGASGLAQIYELVKQLRGEAGDRQVEGARIALAENGGGFIGLGEAAMCVHILEGANSHA